jgi:hypothetical protein
MGIGGLHSQESKLIVKTNATHVLLFVDARAYYPNLMVNAGAFPPALGEHFNIEFEGIKIDRETAKALAKRLKASGFEGTVEYEDATTEDGGGKIMINGTFGKTGSPYSILWAPKMLIQTTLTGQLSLMMLIEWLEHYGIPNVSANTDGLVIHCPREKRAICDHLIREWERRAGLVMETDEYEALYARDVNTYFAVKTPDDVKRKGEYATAGLVEKKNWDTEICSDAVAEFLAKGTPIEQTIRACRDLNKFITMTKVNGGGVKHWGDGPMKGQKIADMTPKLLACGWVQHKRGKWRHPVAGDVDYSAAVAHAMCYPPRRPEFLGVLVRWYYSTNAPGPILYRTNGNTVGGSYGSRPVQILPATFPEDIDYPWYIAKACSILDDIGYNVLR